MTTDEDEVVKNAPLTYELYAKICTQLITSLALLHTAGITHGDIASKGVDGANIVIDGTQQVRFIDFEYAHISTQGDTSQLGDQFTLLKLLIEVALYIQQPTIAFVAYIGQLQVSLTAIELQLTTE